MTVPARPLLSVLLITLDEERMLEEVLSSVAWADEIVVVDGGSTDRTEAIARRFTDRFHVHPFEGYGAQRQRSLELSSGEWILYIDGDEVVTPELASSIRAAVANPGGHAGFRVRFHTYMLGRWFGRRGWRREWKVRLFARGRGTFTRDLVHEGAAVRGPIGALRGAIRHFPYRDLDHQVAKLNRYTTLQARERSARRAAGSPLGALGRGMARFVRDYLFGGDFLHGGAGLVRAVNSGYFTFLKYAKTWEIRNARTGDTPSREP